MRQTLPGAAVERLRATAPGLHRVARGLAACCIVASSAGCLLTRDLPDPALDIPDGYKAARLTAPDAPPKLDWWRGFRSSELTTLMEEAQTVNLDIAAAVARLHAGRRAGAYRGRGAAAEPQRRGSGDLFPHVRLKRQRTEQWRARGGQLFGIAQRQLRTRFLGQKSRRVAGGGRNRHRELVSIAKWWRLRR